MSSPTASISGTWRTSNPITHTQCTTLWEALRHACCCPKSRNPPPTMVRLASLHWILLTCILCNDVDLSLLLLNGPSLWCYVVLSFWPQLTATFNLKLPTQHHNCCSVLHLQCLIPVYGHRSQGMQGAGRFLMSTLDLTEWPRCTARPTTWRMG